MWGAPDFPLLISRSIKDSACFFLSTIILLFTPHLKMADMEEARARMIAKRFGGKAGGAATGGGGSVRRKKKAAHKTTGGELIIVQKINV